MKSLTWRGVIASVRSAATWRQVGYHLVAGRVIALRAQQRLVSLALNLGLAREATSGLLW